VGTFHTQTVTFCLSPPKAHDTKCIQSLSNGLSTVTSQERWCTPIIPALKRLRQEDLEFEASLGYKYQDRVLHPYPPKKVQIQVSTETSLKANF
jgi:hypothetical protein